MEFNNITTCTGNTSISTLCSTVLKKHGHLHDEKCYIKIYMYLPFFVTWRHTE